MMKKQLHQQMNNKTSLQSPKLEAIEEAPLGLVIYDRSVLNNFTIGTVGAMKFKSGSCAGKIFGFPNGTRIFHGLVSILNYYQFQIITR
jgi:hypothetical protein